MDTDLTDRGVVHRVPDAGRAAHKAKVMPRMDRVPRVHKHSVELVLDWLRGRSCRGDREVLGNVEGLGEANRPADLLLSGGAKKIKALELETEDIGGLVDREPLDRIDLCTTPARKDKFWGGLLDKKKNLLQWYWLSPSSRSGLVKPLSAFAIESACKISRERSRKASKVLERNLHERHCT